MPQRTDEEKEFIDSLPIKDPGEKCNARTPNSPTGYCRLHSGYKTDHVGNGRCKFHGGLAGRRITHGLYSKQLPSTIRKEFDKLSKSPELINLSSELALTKTLLLNFLENIEDKLNDTDSNWWVQEVSKGVSTMSGEAVALMKLLEQMGKIFSRMSAVETKLSNQLTIRDVYVIINQLKIGMNETCQSCPVRKQIMPKMDKVRIAEVVDVQYKNVKDEK